jgi:hypothetical protein
LASTFAFEGNISGIGRRVRRRRQLLITSRKPENTGNWKRKWWMAVYVEYAVEDPMGLSHRLRCD